MSTVFCPIHNLAVYYNCIPTKETASAINTDKYPASLGFTLELCAGIVDKEKPLSEIAAEEIREECGYEIEPEKMQQVIQFRFSAPPKPFNHSPVIFLNSCFYI